MRNIPLKMFMENSLIFGNVLQPYIELNKRRSDRFKIGRVVYTLMSWNVSEDHVFLGRLNDINKQGCAINYMAGRSTSGSPLMQKSCKLKFISPLKMFELEKNDVVYDIEIMKYSTERISVRRCGIKFDNFVKVEHLR